MVSIKTLLEEKTIIASNIGGTCTCNSEPLTYQVKFYKVTKCVLTNESSILFIINWCLNSICGLKLRT